MKLVHVYMLGDFIASQYAWYEDFIPDRGRFTYLNLIRNCLDSEELKLQVI